MSREQWYGLIGINALLILYTSGAFLLQAYVGWRGVFFYVLICVLMLSAIVKDAPPPP